MTPAARCPMTMLELRRSFAMLGASPPFSRRPAGSALVVSATEHRDSLVHATGVDLAGSLRALAAAVARRAFGSRTGGAP